MSDIVDVHEFQGYAGAKRIEIGLALGRIEIGLALGRMTSGQLVQMAAGRHPYWWECRCPGSWPAMATAEIERRRELES